MPGPLVGAGIAGAGIAVKGLGKALLKNVVKRIKKTPNKEFKGGTVKSGKAQKKKTVQEQKNIYEKGGVGLRDYSKGRSKGQAAKKDVIGPKGEIIKKGRK